MYDVSHHVNVHTYWLTFKVACNSMYFGKVQTKYKVNSIKGLLVLKNKNYIHMYLILFCRFSKELPIRKLDSESIRAHPKSRKLILICQTQIEETPQSSIRFGHNLF